MIRWLRHLTAGLRALVARRRDERALRDEYDAFVAEAAAAKMAAGMLADEARAAAVRECGSLARARDEVRDVSWESRIDDLARDVRVAIRALHKTPAFTLTAVATLALGIGVNTAIFSLANGLLLRPVPGANLSRVVALAHVSPQRADPYNLASPSERRAIESASLPDVRGAFTSDPIIGVISHNGLVEPVAAEAVSAPYFQAFGIRPIAGRFLSRADDVDSTAGTPVIISERLFRLWFNGDATAAIGASAFMAGQSVTVAGVVGREFRGTWLPTMMSADVWLPAAAAHRFSTIQGVRGQDRWRRTFLWLTPAASIEGVTAAVETIGRSLPVENESSGPLTVIDAERAILFDAFMRPGRMTAAFFVGLSLLVFLIACANLTNLVLARATSRSGEIAIRLAMGSGRVRVARLLVTEVALVTAIAGVVALGVAYGFTALMTRVPLPRLDLVAPTFDPTPDVTVFSYAMAIAATAALVVGMAPAWLVANAAPMRSLKAGGFGGGTKRGARARAAMIGVQVTLSTVLLVLAGLITRSALVAATVDTGYETSRGTMASLNFDLHRYDEARGRHAQARILEVAGQVPGVDRALLTSGLPPFGPVRWLRSVQTDDGVESRGSAGYTHVSAGLFEALGVPVLEGREFRTSDGEGSPRVAVINQAMVAQLEMAGSPVGRRLRLAEDAAMVEVVGVVADVSTHPRLPDRRGPIVFLATSQHYMPQVTVIVTSDTPARMIEPLRQAIRSADANLAVLDARVLADANWMMTTLYRFAGAIVTALGAVGFGIALLGLYGVLTFIISQRTREFGIRRALGARTSSIYGLVVRSGLVMAGGGTLAGVVLALGAARFIEHLLDPGIEPHDPATLTTVVVTLVAAAAIGSALAARRAARVDPNVALRDL